MLTLLLKLLDQSFNKRSWHGPNLRSSIRGLSLDELAWRPGPGRHNIWEQTLHSAYWKYVVRRRLLGEKRGSFPLKGSNWFKRPVDMTEAAWKADVALLEDTHQSLRTAVAAMPHRKLTGANLDLIVAIAAHDVYHAGQIQLLKRLANRGPKSSL